MLVLGLDTSTPAVTVAVARIGEVETLQTVTSLSRVANNQHGELLAPLIEEVLDKVEATPNDLGAIAAGLGPGPFTGLRVGIMTAKAMADALGLPVYGECSLDLIASSVLIDHGLDHAASRPFVCASDARRKQVYWAEYAADGTRVAGPEITAPAELAGRLAGRVEVVAGAGVVMYREHFTGFEIIEQHLYPSAATLATAVADRALRGAPSDDLTPLYLRRPDAQPPSKPKAVTPS